MSCYHPLKGFIVGTTLNGKKDIKIRPYEVDHIELLSNGQFIDRPSRDSNLLGKPYYKYDTIPCGRCIGCRLQRSKSWADRGVTELQYHDSNLFITLTYDDDHVPVNKAINDNGDIIMVETLLMSDLQKFWKSLRKYLDKNNMNKIKYLACGEYGENTFRPHYHAIVYGLFLSDLVPYKQNELGDWLFTSEILNSIWKKGFCIVGEATWQSIAYVSRYVTKKKFGKEAEIYERLNILPEFLVMSRNPGIGRQFYEDNKEKLFKESKYFYPTRYGYSSAVVGRYYNNLFESDFDSGSVEFRKDKLKKQYEDSIKFELENTSNNFLEYLNNKEYNKKVSIENLMRNKI